MSGGELEKLLKARKLTEADDDDEIIRKGLTEAESQFIFQELVKALLDLRDIGDGKKRCHRDVKPQNILMEYPNFDPQTSDLDTYIKTVDITRDNVILKLGDLGIASSTD
jgi:serine/threonine protein kinase